MRRLTKTGRRSATIEELEGRRLLTAVSPRLVADLTTAPDKSIDNGIIQVAGTPLFVGGTKATGSELFTSDGADGSTRLWRDLQPGPASSFPQKFNVAPDGSFAFFLARTGDRQALWLTDGQTATPILTQLPTQFMTILNVTDAGAYVAQETEFEFKDDDGREVLYSDVWFADGQDGSLSLLRSFEANDDEAGVRYSDHVALSDGTFVFQHCVNEEEECQVWKSDGTYAGTQKLLEVENDASIYRRGEVLYLSNDAGQLVPFDGSGLGEPIDATNPFSHGFTATDTAVAAAFHGSLIAATDLDAEPHVIVDGNNVRLWANETNILALMLRSNPRRYELWSTDGTPAGSRLVRDFGDRPLDRLATRDDLSYLVQTMDDTGTLWRTDGTPEGTREIFTGPYARFSAISANFIGEELWVSQDTASGREFTVFRDDVAASTLANIWTGTDDTRRVLIQPFGNRQLLQTDFQLWVTSATGDDPLPITAAGDGILEVFVIGDSVWYITAEFHSSPREMWINQGSVDSNVPVSEVIPQLTGLSFPDALSLGEQLLFVTSEPGLWVTDGTAAGTTKLLDLPREAFLAYEVDGQVYLSAQGGTPQSALWWVTDGTAVGTRAITTDEVPERPPTELTFEVNGFVYRHEVGSEWTSQSPSGRISIMEGPPAARDAIQVGHDVFYTSWDNTEQAYVIYRIVPGHATPPSRSSPYIQRYGDLHLATSSLGQANGSLIVHYDDGFYGGEPWLFPIITSIDLDRNDVVDCRDVQAIQAAFPFNGSVTVTGRLLPLDINADSVVDDSDVAAWLDRTGSHGDVNVDGVVNALDLNEIGRRWTQNVDGGWCEGDLNGDGVVGAADLNAVARRWLSEPTAAAVGSTARPPRAPLAARAIPPAQQPMTTTVQEIAKPAHLGDPADGVPTQTTYIDLVFARDFSRHQAGKRPHPATQPKTEFEIVDLRNTDGLRHILKQQL